MEDKYCGKYEEVFSLEDETGIIVEADILPENIDCCYDVPIFLQTKEKKYLLTETPLYYNMQRFSERLDKALKKELYLHESIKQDIGYLFNEYSHNEFIEDRSMFVLEKTTKKDSWVGYRYYVWSSCANNCGTATWIYNDGDDIVLEVTALYIWQDPEAVFNYVPYIKWIKDYKSYFKTMIPKKIAQEWLIQAKGIVKQIQMNIERFKKEYEEEQKMAQS